MNHRLLIALPLAAVLAMPALAQTTSSDQISLPPRSRRSRLRPTRGNATGKAPLAAPSREGFWGRVNPFARKKYVQRQTEPIRDRVNELDELTSAERQADQRRRFARHRLASGSPRTRRTKPTSTPSTPATRPLPAQQSAQQVTD